MQLSSEDLEFYLLQIRLGSMEKLDIVQSFIKRHGQDLIIGFSVTHKNGKLLLCLDFLIHLRSKYLVGFV